MPLPVFAPLSQLLRLLARGAVLGLCASLVLTTARADEVQRASTPRAATPPQAALDHYNRGRAHYQAGHYRDAVIELERALALDPDSPNLTYNLARVYELLGQIERSTDYYRRYYALLPESEQAERARVAGTIKRLEGARLQPLRPPETRTIPVLVPSERGVADGAFWTLAALSLAALAAGSITGGLALRVERQTHGFVLGRAGDVRDREAKADRADRLALASDVSLAAGAVGALSSVLLYALRSHPVAPVLSLAPHGLTLSLRGEL